MSTFGPNGPASNQESQDSSGQNWGTLTLVEAQDGFSSTTGFFGSNGVTNIITTGHHFDTNVTLGAGEAILGIQVTIYRFATSQNIMPPYGNVVDNLVQIKLNGGSLGSNYANTVTSWPNANGSTTYGGPTDLWGFGSVALSDINSSFGGNVGIQVLFQAKNLDDPNSDNVDYIGVTIYTGTAPIPPVPPYSGPFLPTNIASSGGGCLYWFVADDIQLANGSLVKGNTQWVNRGLLGGYALSSDPFGVNGPQLQQYTLNNHSVLNFDPTNLANYFYAIKYQNSSANTIIGSDGFPIRLFPTQPVVFSVYQSNVPPQGSFGSNIVQCGNANFNAWSQLAGWWFLWGGRGPTGQYNLQYEGIPVVPSDVGWSLRTDIVDNSNNITVKANGYQLFTDSLESIYDPGTNDQTIVIGGQSTTSFLSSFNGSVAEVIIFDGQMASADILSVETYLKWKYFIAGGYGTSCFIQGNHAGASGLYNPKTPLFTQSGPQSGVMPLFLECHLSQTQSTNFYVGSSVITPSSTQLYIGSTSVSSSGLSLYHDGYGIDNNGINFYIGSTTLQSNNFPLYVGTATGIFLGETLYTDGVNRTTSPELNLFIKNVPAPNTNLATSLFVNSNTAGSSGAFSGTSLYTQSSSMPGILPVFLQGESIGWGAAPLPLFVGTESVVKCLNTTADLVIQNNTSLQSNKSTLFTAGLGQLQGGLVGQSSMPLYLARPSGGICFSPMYIQSTTTPNQSPLYAFGAFYENSGVTLSIVGGPQIISSGITPFFAQATLSQSSGIPLFSMGLPTEESNAQLYTRGF